MPDFRKKDALWRVVDDDGRTSSWEQATVAVLMDIRDELKRLNGLLYCRNFMGIPLTLTEIRRNTAKPKRRKKPS